MCDVPFHDNSPPLDVSKDQFEDFSESNNEVSSIDDDSFSIVNIDYVEASPPDSELVSSEVMEIVFLKVGGIDDDIPLTIKDDNLREKLLNVNLLIATIEALNDNPTPSSDCKTKSSSTSLNSFLEETNTFHNSFLEVENFYFDLGEISSGSTTTHSDISLSDYEAFYFDDDHIKEISSGSTTTHSDISLSDYEAFYFDDDHVKEISSGSTTIHSDISLSEYDSFIFDLTHEEFADELAHIRWSMIVSTFGICPIRHMLYGSLLPISRERKPKKGQNQIKTGQKREAWRNREKSEAVIVDRGRKTEENAKRRAKFANSYKCKKQTIVATSTTEAEYVAAASCLKNPVFHPKTKHIEIRDYFIKDAYEKKLIQESKIHTNDNVADLLTKAFDVSSADSG
nr:hypothetical protein [Tanacetum cinerariifolium]